MVTMVHNGLAIAATSRSPGHTDKILNLKAHGMEEVLGDERFHPDFKGKSLSGGGTHVAQSGSLQVALERVMFGAVCVKPMTSGDSMKLMMPGT